MKIDGWAVLRGLAVAAFVAYVLPHDHAALFSLFWMAMRFAVTFSAMIAVEFAVWLYHEWNDWGK